MRMEQIFVLQFLIGGVLGTIYAATIVTSAWCFESLSLAAPARLTERKAGADRMRIFITKERRIRHSGYGLDIWEVPVERKGQKGEMLLR